MNKIKMIMLFALTFVMMQPAFAQTNTYYTNSNKIEINKEQYDYLLNFYTANEIDSMSQEQINNELSKHYVLSQTEEKYIKTMTYIGKSNQRTSYESEVSEAEYNNPILPRAACTEFTSMDCWETSYKKLAIFVWFDVGNLSSTRLVLRNIWKIMPTVRSFDVIGMRFTGNFVPSNAYGDQYTYAPGTGIVEVNYGYGGTNMKIASNGIGISQNLLNDTTITELENRIVIDGTASGPINVYGSYQHATSDLSLSDSKSYSFGVNGLGGVFSYSSSISSKYDGMQGVHAYFVA